MNKKGFTTIELIVSFVMVTIMLASLIGFSITYRDRVKDEEIRSQLNDFKNTITKVVYDDIITFNYTGISLCVGQDNCVNFVDEDGDYHTLKIINDCSSDCNYNPCKLTNCGVYLVYDETKYFLPDSDLNTFYSESDGIKIIETASNLSSFELKTYENSIYSLKMTFKHYKMKDDTVIQLTIN